MYKTKIINKYNYPLLPVPTAEETLDRFLEWVKPIITEKQYLEAKTYVEDYLSSNLKNKIQDFLVKRAEDKNNSWLVEWWIDYVYLSSRGPVTPECNAPSLFTPHPDVDRMSLPEIMAVFAYTIAEQYLDFKLNGLSDYQPIENPKIKMSFDQSAGVFGAFREPNKIKDDYYVADEFLEHIILNKNNISYKIKVIENKKLIPINNLYNTFKHIIKNENEKVDVNLNFITAQTSREKAKDILDDCLKNEKNYKSYDEIRKGIFFMAYDEDDLKNDVDRFKYNLHASDYNRWHGKSISWIFNKDKTVTFVADHTFIDGGSSGTITSKIVKKLAEKITFNDEECSLNYKKLEFELTDAQKTILKKTFDDYKKYTNNTNIILGNNSTFTRSFLKEHGIKSIDGLMHTIFQIAQYKTNKQFRNTYVAVDVRNFFRGRTECIRPISEYSKEFAIKYSENKFKSKEEALDLLNKVFDEHYKRAKDCKRGHGINRHMFGMTIAYLENQKKFNEPRPKLFDCDAWKIISENPISTSSVVSETGRGAYFDPVHPDGIGIFYSIGNKELKYSVSGWIKDNIYLNDFTKNLNETINEFIEHLKNIK